MIRAAHAPARVALAVLASPTAARAAAHDADAGRRRTDPGRRDLARRDPLPRRRSARGPRPGQPGRRAGAALPREPSSRRWASSPAAPTAAGSSRFDMVGIDVEGARDAGRSAPAARTARARLRGPTSSPTSGVQAPERRARGRRAGLRRLRHPGPRVRLGRLQGRRPQGQGPGDAQQRPGLGPAALRRQAPPLLRPLDLQVRERRAAGRGGRDHHPHHALGRLSVAGGADLLERRAVRAARRAASRASRSRPGSTEDAGRTARRPLAGQDLDEARRAGPAAATSDPVPLGVTHLAAARERDPRRVETGNVARPPARRRPEAPRRGRRLHRAPRPPGHRRRRTPKGDTIYNGAVDNASGCAQLLAVAARLRGAAPSAPRRSILFAFVAAEEQGLLGSRYYAAHPTFPAGRIAANINFDGGEHLRPDLATSTYIGLGKSTLDAVVDARRGDAGPRASRATSSPTRARSTAPTSSTSPASACPRSTSTPAPTSSATAPPRHGRKQDAYDSTCYHQPSDELGADWNYDGMVEDARLAFDGRPRDRQRRRACRPGTRATSSKRRERRRWRHYRATERPERLVRKTVPSRRSPRHEGHEPSVHVPFPVPVGKGSTVGLASAELAGLVTRWSGLFPSAARRVGRFRRASCAPGRLFRRQEGSCGGRRRERGRRARSAP